MPPRRSKSKTRSATPAEQMLGVFGLSPGAYIRRGLPADAWQTWNRAYGSTWRLQHGCANELDRSRFDRGLVDLAAIVPDPPGLGGHGGNEKAPDSAEQPAPPPLICTGPGVLANNKNGTSNA